MKNIVLLFLLSFSFSIYSQTNLEEVFSNKLNTKREIIVKLPNSYGTNPEKKYPLLLVLDAEYLFMPFEANMAYGNYWDDMPDVIIVGINQNKKNERYDDSEFDPATGLPVKNGAMFFEFIGAELLPYLEKKYRVAPFKIIAGLDSTAGLLNAFLLKENPIFNAYISLSPELAAGMEDRIPARLASLKTPVFYYQATADGDLKKFQDQIKYLDEKITAIKNPELRYKFDNFKSDSHYSLVLKAIPNALYHIFSIYQPISPVEYQEKIAKMPNDFTTYLIDKYDIIEKYLGIKMPIRLNDFKAIEAAAIQFNAPEEFERLAQLSGQQYEKTMLPDYHMAMYYEKRNEYKKAVKFYQSSFMKEPIGDLTKDMMMNKAEDLKKFLPKKGSKKGKEEVIEEPAPTETPTEEKKPE